MKYDLYPILIENLQHIYKVENENKLYKYLKIRTAIILNKKNVSHLEMLKQMIDDLNLETFEDSLKEKIVYQNEDYTLQELSGEVMDNFEFRANLYGNTEVKSITNEVFRKGSYKSTKFKNTKLYKEYLKFNRLSYLNDLYSAKVTSSMGIDNFKVSESHNNMKRTVEEVLEAEINSFEHGELLNVSTIKESQLEDYLIKNLDLIEKGLIFIGRQVKVEGGIIDILAKDANDNICIVELKVAHDKSLVWQAIHYQKEMGKRYRSKIRMITVSPSYSKSIYETLKSLKNVEILSYQIKVNSGKIVELKMKKE